MKIINYKPDLAIHFEQINRDWIEKYFVVEPIDEQVITQPEKEIITKGGAVLFAVEGEDVLGTVALKKHTEQKIELTKMGVYEHARNRGIGKELIVAAIEKAKEMGFSELVLYSNRKLENAIHLYRKMGFTELACYDDLYERCDIQMEMSLI